MIAGYRDGFVSNALFNKPSAIIEYVYSTSNSIISRNTHLFFLSNSSSCLYADSTNYTKCLLTGLSQDTTLALNNIRFINTGSITNKVDGKIYVYVSDSENDCIREIDLSSCLINSVYIDICMKMRRTWISRWSARRK